MRQRSLSAMSAAPTRAAGQTFTQVAIARITAAACGRVAIRVTPTRARGTVTESIRPRAIGPRRSRNATHHQATAVRSRERPHPVTNPKATASSSMTMVSHVLPYWSGPNRVAANIGTRATTG